MVAGLASLTVATSSNPMKAVAICTSAQSQLNLSDKDAAKYGLIVNNKGTITYIKMGDKITAVGRPSTDIPKYSVLYKNFYSKKEYSLNQHSYHGGNVADKTTRISTSKSIVSLEVISTTKTLNTMVILIILILFFFFFFANFFSFL